MLTLVHPYMWCHKFSSAQHLPWLIIDFIFYDDFLLNNLMAIDTSLKLKMSCSVRSTSCSSPTNGNFWVRPTPTAIISWRKLYTLQSLMLQVLKCLDVQQVCNYGCKFNAWTSEIMLALLGIWFQFRDAKIKLGKAWTAWPMNQEH